MDENNNICSFKQETIISMLETTLSIFTRIDKDTDQYIMGLGEMFDYFIMNDLENEDFRDILKQHFNTIGENYYTNLVNHLSIGNNIEGIGKKFIDGGNLFNGDYTQDSPYVENNTIKYQTNCVKYDSLNNKNSNGITYSKNVATFNNIYVSTWSNPTIGGITWTCYIIQIGNISFYIDNGSFFDIWMNENEFGIPGNPRDDIDQQTGSSTTGFTSGWQHINFTSNALTGDTLNNISIDLSSATGNLTLELELYVESTVYHGNGVSANPNTALSGLTKAYTSSQIDIDNTTNGLVEFPFTGVEIDKSKYYYIWVKQVGSSGNNVNIKFAPTSIVHPDVHGGAGNNSGTLNHVVNITTPGATSSTISRTEDFVGDIRDWLDNYIMWYSGEFKRVLKNNIECIMRYINNINKRNL